MRVHQLDLVAKTFQILGMQNMKKLNVCQKYTHFLFHHNNVIVKRSHKVINVQSNSPFFLIHCKFILLIFNIVHNRPQQNQNILMQLQNSLKFILLERFKILIHWKIIYLDNFSYLLIRNIFMDICNDYLVQFEIFTIHSVVNRQK